MNSFEEIKQWNTKEWMIAAVIIIVIVAVGLFALNQFMAFKYKAVFLSDPCGLCRSLNTEVEDCFWQKIEVQGNSYPQVDYKEAIKEWENFNPTAPK